MDYEVLLCSYNGEKYIKDQINSILSQSLKPIRIIISDDGSTDNTLNIINDIIAKTDDVIIDLIDGPKKGVVYNFLNALNFTQSEFVFFSDQDDIWLREKACFFHNEIKRNITGKPLLIFSDANLIINGTISNKTFFETESIYPNVMLDNSILFKNCVQGASMMVNRNLIKLCLDSLEYTDKSKILMHDWWFALLAKYYGEHVFINKPLILYRQHENNLIGAKGKYYRYLTYITNFKYHFDITKRITEQKEEFIKVNAYLKRNDIVINNHSVKYISFIKKKLLSYFGW